MAIRIPAIFKDGQFKPLTPVDYSDNQKVELIVSPAPTTPEITPELMLNRLRAAGLLVEDLEIPADFKEISQAEEERLGLLFSSERSIADEIIEDRGEY